MKEMRGEEEKRIKLDHLRIEIEIDTVGETKIQEKRPIQKWDEKAIKEYERRIENWEPAKSWTEMEEKIRKAVVQKEFTSQREISQSCRRQDRQEDSLPKKHVVEEREARSEKGENGQEGAKNELEELRKRVERLENLWVKQGEVMKEFKSELEGGYVESWVKEVTGKYFEEWKLGSLSKRGDKEAYGAWVLKTDNRKKEEALMNSMMVEGEKEFLVERFMNAAERWERMEQEKLYKNRIEREYKVRYSRKGAWVSKEESELGQ
ncbi:hypothetical protein QAD02_007418 [Eretmocerus hayati]|uniref:Uncharacterized protein n=1 Tax=Eretmocerus hayati TaxID=131215 RepID=A0ACC2N4X7_9HYME|nr:hypothetical protein QAD02_007418 [Eretmocerus hayati]